MVEWLGDDFQLYIVTSDRDLGDHQPYSGIRSGVWQPVGKAQVLYLAPQKMTLSSLYRLFRTFTYDLIYLNSFFAPLTLKLLLLRRIGLLPKRPFILAPRGEFSPGALTLKQYKKRMYIFLIKVLRLYANITWQASSEYEKKDILSILGRNSIRKILLIKVAPNLPPREGDQAIAENISKRVGSVRVIFLSRIARKKNFDIALTFLAKVSGEVQFDIYGPIEDMPYWKECENLIYKLPDNVGVNYKGLADPE